MTRDKRNIEIVEEVIPRPMRSSPLRSAAGSGGRGRYPDVEASPAASVVVPKALRLRYFVTILNTVILILAIVLMVTIFELDKEWSQFQPFLQVFIAVPGVSTVFLCFSLVILNLFSYFTFLKHRHGLYVWLAIFLCVLLVYEMRIVITGLVYTGITKNHISRSLHNAMERYENNTSSLDYTQITLECCGRLSPMDWYSTPFSHIPLSCCPGASRAESKNWCEPSDIDSIFPDGCLEKLYRVPVVGLHVLYCTLGVVLIVKIGFLIISCKLASITDVKNN